MQLWSQLFIPTLREAPADAEVASHKFLVRAGYIRQLSAGIYSYLYLGQRAILKISDVVRQEMNTIGQEFYLPALHPREIWEASGRWTGMGDNMFRLKDRKGADLCLGMTHEEVMTDIARKELRSYKQLPQIWYQIQSKFRDEPRPKSGLLRVRQFTMKDSYSFDLDAAGLDVSYKKHYAVYCRIFERCGLDYVVVEAHSGAMGGAQSQEFMVYTDAGEDLVASCPKCGYAANLEKATSRLEKVVELAPNSGDVPTPNVKTIERLSEFLKVGAEHLIKTLAYVSVYVDGRGKRDTVPVIFFLRGDHSLNEAKLVGSELVKGDFSGAAEFRPMLPEEIEEFFGCEPGYLGPTPALLNATLKGWRGQIYADNALLGRNVMIAGANKAGFHRYIETGDLPPVAGTFYGNFRLVKEGEGCPKCGQPLKLGKTVEIGHIFKLGYKYSDSMGARVLDKDGKEVTPIMGSYGIGIERILTSVIEQNHDENGFWLPPRIAPFEVIVVPTNVADAKLSSAARQIAADLEQAGLEVLLDDRDERPGVKFKDADLVGIPFRINVGKKLAEGKVEVIIRSTRASRDVIMADVTAVVTELVRSAS